jgi:hypothetical protein
VALLVIVTVAPLITPPFVSATVTLNAPLAVTCAKAELDTRNTVRTKHNKLKLAPLSLDNEN